MLCAIQLMSVSSSLLLPMFPQTVDSSTLSRLLARSRARQEASSWSMPVNQSDKCLSMSNRSIATCSPLLDANIYADHAVQVSCMYEEKSLNNLNHPFLIYMQLNGWHETATRCVPMPVVLKTGRQTMPARLASALPLTTQWNGALTTSGDESKHLPINFVPSSARYRV